MTITPFIDRTGLAKKIIQGGASGSATIPFSLEKKIRTFVSGTTSGSNTGQIDRLRQGVEIVNNAQRYFGIQPKIGTETNSNIIKVNTFGIAKVFKENQIFQDLAKLDPKTYLQDAEGSQQFPAILTNASLRNPEQMNGVLEPLTIKDKVSFTSLYGDREAHDIYSAFMDGGTDAQGRTNVVEQFYEKDLPTTQAPYLDALQSFGSTASGSVKHEGVISPQKKSIAAFDETAFDTFLSSSIQSPSFSKLIISMSLGRSGSQRDFGLITNNKKSATAGFQFNSSTEEGTDSIAFGDTQKYERIGFQRELDEHTGSFPTIARTGDRDRTGVFSVHFDDTRTIVFEKSANLDVGRNLKSGSNYLTLPLLSQSIQRDKFPRFYPYIGQNTIVRATSGSLHATGTVRRGVADNFIRFTPGEDLKPFFEDNIFWNVKDSFWITGSRYEDVGTGFQQPVWSKTKIEIALNHSVASASFSLASGSNIENYPMGYYNFKLKKWEGIGTGKVIQNNQTNNTTKKKSLNEQCIGFNASIGFEGKSDTEQQIAGLPVSNFGFPVHAKFHATSSQILHMSSAINQPFLLEKFVYIFSASFQNELPDAGSLSHFFILNQRDNFAISQSISTQYSDNTIANVSVSLPTTIHLSAGGVEQKVGSTRDIITFSNVFLQGSKDFLKTNAFHDLRISGTLDATTEASTLAITSGTYILSGIIRSPTINQNQLGSTNLGGDGSSAILMRSEGGRDNIGTVSGRSFVNSVFGINASGSFVSGSTTFRPNKAKTNTNPYIVLPTDKLIFGWQSMISGTANSTSRLNQINFSTAPGKLILYGSLLRNGQEFHDTLNQNLTSKVVHEIIGAEPIVDQFDVEYRQQLSGTYIDNYVTGSMNNDPTLHRQRQGSTFGNVGSLSGSNLKQPQASSDNERYYDTLLPKPDEITIANGGKIINYGGSVNMLEIGHSVRLDGVADADWEKAFPFESKYSSLLRQADPTAGTVGVADNSASPTLVFDRISMITTRLKPLDIDQGGGIKPITGSLFLSARGSIGTVDSPIFIRHYYGIGDYISGSVKWLEKITQPPSLHVINGVRDHRGWKYGILNGLPQFTKSIFRRNRYGQLRDMLEQRQDGKIYDTEGVLEDGTITNKTAVINSPVQAGFTKTPTSTSGSNLSVEATSSLPFFDGEVRNREDPLNFL